MATYYDYVLGFIPLVLLGIGGGLHVAGLQLQVALATSGLLAIGLMGHALFVNSPVDGGHQQSAEPVETQPSYSMSD
ncbi:MAG: hypothetical protein U5K70_06265 [Halodesulfurarchaeum sp.]|nr:hypothetical protein [Halodesulfurarchaeum sp.]